LTDHRTGDNRRNASRAARTHAAVALALCIASSSIAAQDSSAPAPRHPRLAASAPAPGRAEARPLRAVRRSPQPRIVNGLLGAGLFPTVGFFYRFNGLQYAPTCSGTLIGCQTFLTAAHCVAGWTASSAGAVYLQHAGFFSVSSVTTNPSYCGVGCRSDLALLSLSPAVSGIPPSPINTASKPPYGTQGSIAGFGITGGGAGGLGLIRYGNVITAACTSVPDAHHVCWDFASPIGPPGDDSNTCNGDSGGPLFTAHAGTVALVSGVTSGGVAASCQAPDNSFDADVHLDRSWIQAVGGADVTATSCGAVPQVSDPASEVHAADSVTDSSELWTFQVQAGAARLRLALNALAGHDFDLFVRRGTPPTSSPPAWDCASANVDTLPEFCELTNPEGGTWYARAISYTGSAAYQLTVTALGGAVLDIDGNGVTDSLTDGLLVLRYLFDFRGGALVAGAVDDEGCTTCTAPEIEAYLGSVLEQLDVDGDGEPEPLTDGLLIVRYLFGFRGAPLVADAVDTLDCTRCTPAMIEAHLDMLDG
jgi:hypothetical protein